MPRYSCRIPNRKIDLRLTTRNSFCQFGDCVITGSAATTGQIWFCPTLTYVVVWRYKFVAHVGFRTPNSSNYNYCITRTTGNRVVSPGFIARLGILPHSAQQIPAHFIRRMPTSRSFAAWFVSVVVHVGLLLAVGLIWTNTLRYGNSERLDSHWNVLQTDAVETIEPEAVVQIDEEVETQDDQTTNLQDTGGVGFKFRDPNLASPQVAMSWFPQNQTIGELAEVVAPAAGTGDLGSAGNAASGPGGFFGSAPVGRRFVYVVDCSRSMNHPHNSEGKTRFGRLKIELVKSISSMDSTMEFFIIFFNEEAIPMPARTLQPAWPNAKKRYLYWMQSIRADGKTDPTDAVKLAHRLNPDVIYFLTDGSFKHKAELELLNIKPSHTVMHTLSFAGEISEEMRPGYERLVAGDYRGARRMLNDKELRIAQGYLRSQKTLAQLAERHRGEFRMIP